MASNSPEYPKMQDWTLRSENNKVYGPPHPIDGGNYAPLSTAIGKAKGLDTSADKWMDANNEAYSAMH